MADKDMPLIRLRGITRVYGEGEAEVRALNGLDLDIGRGEFVAIMGPSGSGKSTAMNVIGCLDRPTSGSYHFNGVEIAGLSRDQRALLRRHYLGFVFQGYNLLPRTTALDNVELPLILSDHADWDELTDTIAELGAGEVWVTHGREEALVRWCELNGIAAKPLHMVGYEDEAE